MIGGQKPKWYNQTTVYYIQTAAKQMNKRVVMSIHIIRIGQIILNIPLTG